MLRPDVFGGLATHAGDALFEVCYRPTCRHAVRVLRDGYDGSWEAFSTDLRGRPAMTRTPTTTCSTPTRWPRATPPTRTARSACPIDPATGVLVPEVWERWLALDPVRMAPDHAEALRSMRAIWIDAGNRDEYFLDLGAEAFRAALRGRRRAAHPLRAVRRRARRIEYRYPLALRHLAERLAADG